MTEAIGDVQEINETNAILKALDKKQVANHGNESMSRNPQSEFIPTQGSKEETPYFSKEFLQIEHGPPSVAQQQFSP